MFGYLNWCMTISQKYSKNTNKIYKLEKTPFLIISKSLFQHIKCKFERCSARRGTGFCLHNAIWIVWNSYVWSSGRYMWTSERYVWSSIHYM